MNTSGTAPVLVLACGNPSRGDDGIGPFIAEALEAAHIPGVGVELDYQLNLEDALAMEGRKRVVFVDASYNAPAPFHWHAITPEKSASFTSHALAPAALLALARDCFANSPEAWVLAVRGYAFDLGEGLSTQGQSNAQTALSFLLRTLERWQAATVAAGGGGHA